MGTNGNNQGLMKAASLLLQGKGYVHTTPLDGSKLMALE